MKRLLAALTLGALSATSFTTASAVGDLAAVALGSLVPSWAVPQTRLARVAGSETVQIELVLPWRDPAGARRFALDVSDPSSPNFRKHLTSAQFRTRFSPTDTTIRLARTWLQAQGLELGAMPLNKIIVPARGPAARVEKAFGTTLSRYKVGAFALRAPDLAPQLPGALARLGIVVRGLDESASLLTTGGPLTPDMVDHARLAPSFGVSAPPPIPTTPANAADVAPPTAVVYAAPCSGYDGERTDKAAPTLDRVRHPAVACATPIQTLRAAYGVDDLVRRGFDGSGQTVVMVGSHAMRNLPGDLAEWSKRRKLPALKDGQFAQFSYPGAYETPSDPLQTVLRPAVWAVQSAMLFENMRAVAPGANYLYVGSISSLDLQNAMLLAVDQHYGDVIVNGWYSATESQVTPSDTAPIDRAAEQAAATGISLLFASGDLGDNSNFNATQTGRTNVGEQGVTADTPAEGSAADDVTVQNIPVVPAHASVSFPAHNPMVTAVGATSMLIGRGGRYIRELGWSKTTRAFADGKWQDPSPTTFRGSGGGTSIVYDQPGYQAKVVPSRIAQRSTDGLYGRAVPDIAVNGDAETGLLIGYTQRFPDGTDKYSERRANADTASTALFGAILALTNDVLEPRSQKVGFVNPKLYSIRGANVYRDITLMGGVKAGIRTDYLNGASGSTRRVLKTFEQFGSNPPRPGYDTSTGIGAPSRLFVYSVAGIGVLEVSHQR